MNHNVALLVIDAQLNMFDESMPIHNGSQLLMTLHDLCNKAAVADVPIIFVRHDGGPGAVDELGSPGWQIHPKLTHFPALFFVEKRLPDAFHQTSLDVQLKQHKIDHLMIAGMQSDMCINATTRRAVDLGYRVTLIADAHSTFDGEALTAGAIIDDTNAALDGIATLVQSTNVTFIANGE